MGIEYLMVANQGWGKLTGGPERWAGLGEFSLDKKIFKPNLIYSSATDKHG